MAAPPEDITTVQIDDGLLVDAADEEKKPITEKQGLEQALDDSTTETTAASDLEAGPEDPIYVDWEPNDPDNPFHWNRRKKWVVTITACLVTCMSASTGPIIASGYPGMSADLHSSEETNALTLSMYALGFGIAPLALASLSEEFGRRPMYIFSSGLFTIFYIQIALAKNIQTVIIARFIQGAAGSTGATMVGGTVADIWETHERGLAMSSFAFAALFSTGMGPVMAGWIQQTIGWRWIEWIAMIVSGVLTLWLIIYGAQETRGSIILLRRAKRLRKETGDPRYRTKFNPPDMKKLIWISITRPMHLLVTEPIVTSFSAWLGFIWGVLYGLVQSIGLVFQTLYGFNSGQTGLVFLTVCVGTILGVLLNLYQERLYKQNVARVGPEARLYLASVAGIFFVVGAFIYAWTSYSFIHWIAPCIGITIIIMSTFTIYLAVFNYLADAYLIYASSALAGQSLVRNLSAAAFPLFTDQMYKKLDFRWASTLLGLIAAVLAPIPIVLFFYGPRIRARSRFAQNLVKL